MLRRGPKGKVTPLKPKLWAYPSPSPWKFFFETLPFETLYRGEPGGNQGWGEVDPFPKKKLLTFIFMVKLSAN